MNCQQDGEKVANVKTKGYLKSKLGYEHRENLLKFSSTPAILSFKHKSQMTHSVTRLTVSNPLVPDPGIETCVMILVMYIRPPVLFWCGR